MGWSLVDNTIGNILHISTTNTSCGHKKIQELPRVFESNERAKWASEREQKARGKNKSHLTESDENEI